MCGIVGYLGNRDAYPIIIEGLKRLEYRGYDSAGIALFDGTHLNVSKTKGKVADLENCVEKQIPKQGHLGIGHTRWATHGVPNDVNSHPHTSNSGELVMNRRIFVDMDGTLAEWIENESTDVLYEKDKKKEA